MAMLDTFSKQDKVIIALLRSRSVKEAASVSGVSASTIYRLLAKPEFTKEYKDARRKVMESLCGKLNMASHQALEVLLEILNDPNSRDHAKVNAAAKILEFSFKSYEVHELSEVTERIEMLESTGGVPH